MTLVEIMVALAIVFILFAAAAPNFSDWIQNTKIRSATESMLNGLAIAKNEAVHRNTTAQFVTCASNDSSWDVVVSSAAANTNVCNTVANAGVERVQSQILQGGSTNASVNAGQATIAFNGLGRQVSSTDLLVGGATPNPSVAVNIDVSANLSGASCYCPAANAGCGYPPAISYSTTGKLRCLRIVVSSGGQVRMCDPALTPNTPQGC
ncbi:type IV pilus assembly related protein [Sideroxydans lithotrophicus ES-1]|uniref:Type II secretion system protein H n=2 Tax=Sideroxydans TaxID=314343 RepID=D5CTZ9_SIDLE|nr:type IV pilus assembly related protein [Sideroxydans lithotrophicus ES-1]